MLDPYVVDNPANTGKPNLEYSPSDVKRMLRVDKDDPLFITDIRTVVLYKGRGEFVPVASDTPAAAIEFPKFDVSKIPVGATHYDLVSGNWFIHCQERNFHFMSIKDNVNTWLYVAHQFIPERFQPALLEFKNTFQIRKGMFLGTNNTKNSYVILIIDVKDGVVTAINITDPGQKPFTADYDKVTGGFYGWSTSFPVHLSQLIPFRQETICND